MPIPIGTIRNASTPGDDIVQAVRRVLPPAGQRAEAIQKLLDMLGRHLSGKEVLPRDALVRLIEDLARVLKFPPLPQETGRAFVRRLVEVVEALPLPERLAIERQLGGGGLARRLAALTQSGPSAGFGNPTTPLPTGGIRNLPLQLPMPQQAAAAQTPPPSDPALLQAMLKKTYGADDGGADDGGVPAERPEEALQAAEPGEPGRGSPPTSRHGQLLVGNGILAASTASAGVAEEGVEAAAATQPALAEGSESVAATAAGDEVLPALVEGNEAAVSRPSAEAPPEKPDQTSGGAEADTGQGDPGTDVDGFETDGTYGPSRPKGTDARQPAQPSAPRAAPPASALANAAEALLQGSLDLPGPMTEAGPALAMKEAEREPVPARSIPAEPERLAERPRLAEDIQPIAEPTGAEKTETASRGSPAVQRQGSAGEDVTMQQAIALLVESGLPEIIPFAMVPYPPAQEDADDGDGRTDRYPGDDDEGNAGTQGEDREDEEKGQDPESDGDDAADPEASDAYDLYRKLGDLG
ncbi:hypothetical protein N181_21165 [Sinorhizobium fredii USDA 205]|uniref:Uncharacterized protein n=1 Tax=Rhizobium fredii TaxID=380 RepID=A0A844AGA7_RHIFR|nr:hypothetical protein [Sinorhizobium fredii]KSV86455.1 hypothetical protein N181_21165 [Sinorhizobium fredii USDA 205]MQX11993.1 hypothetical protein [Sinorhizobium fredii]GEC32718.1 hypothetical protein EFR01_28890 [Sinorhizobium fredii]GLS12403.1 hypothetical protein GCM10007864_60350 [Sinorhizobium fredii]